ncbi:MAG: glutathione S-transferase family protein [Proteobacteria bacterium]|nr:glutathione S-transferase family protein [Pseudomonadota bacterium]MCZ6782898.1 glutathione S-transferase family protein [Pseudomonadota bacterium]
MHELILHHYDISPYAEKIRLCFGLKGLPWRSVQIPVVMPKPDLTELTGGYRRTPTLQLGADVYCDTKGIARAIEDVAPSPTLFPDGSEAIVPALQRWGETSFMMVVTVLMGEGGVFDEDFMEDRRKMVGDAIDLDQAGVIVPAKLMQLRANLDLLEQQLSDGRDFLLGDAPCLADLAVYHPVMMVGLVPNPKLKALVEPLRFVAAWLARIGAIGHGKREEMDSADAIAVARDAAPAEFRGQAAPPPEGLEVGQSVVVLPEEIGSGPVAGELLPSGPHEIRIRRRGERAGELVVHFPREDYLVVAA